MKQQNNHQRKYAEPSKSSYKSRIHVTHNTIKLLPYSTIQTSLHKQQSYSDKYLVNDVIASGTKKLDIKSAKPFM